jgi:hypothetical protein
VYNVCVCVPETTQNMSIAFIIFIVAKLYAFPALFRHLFHLFRRLSLPLSFIYPWVM